MKFALKALSIICFLLAISMAYPLGGDWIYLHFYVISNVHWLTLFAGVLVLILFRLKFKFYLIIAILSLISFLFPIITSYYIISTLPERLNLTSEQSNLSFSLKRLFVDFPTVSTNRLLIISPLTGEKLETIIYSNNNQSNLPICILIHGGSFTSGSPEYMEQIACGLSFYGISSIACSYSLAPENTYPVALHDIRQVIEMRSELLPENSNSNYFLVGASAGASLAIQEACFFPDTNLAGIINLYGFYDFEMLNPENEARSVDLHSIVNNYKGNFEAKTISPNHLSTKIEKPCLTIHGVLDNIVPISQARQFHENLLKQNKQSHLIEIPFAGHNFDFPAHAPAGQIMLNSMYQFMVKYP